MQVNDVLLICLCISVLPLPIGGMPVSRASFRTRGFASYCWHTRRVCQAHESACMGPRRKRAVKRWVKVGLFRGPVS